MTILEHPAMKRHTYQQTLTGGHVDVDVNVPLESAVVRIVEFVEWVVVVKVAEKHSIVLAVRLVRADVLVAKFVFVAQAERQHRTSINCPGITDWICDIRNVASILICSLQPRLEYGGTILFFGSLFSIFVGCIYELWRKESIKCDICSYLLSFWQCHL